MESHGGRTIKNELIFVLSNEQKNKSKKDKDKYKKWTMKYKKALTSRNPRVFTKTTL